MNPSPKTEVELENWRKLNCYNFDSYSINGNFIYEGFGIEKNGSLYVWYYTEKGNKNNLEIFRTESEIIKYAYEKIKSDKWAKTHCVGFNYDKQKTDELLKILTEMKIDYLQDEIPFNKIAYRTFVFGCDINKVMDLPKKYIESPDN